MIVNNPTGSQALLALLDTFKNVVQDFAARENKLNTSFRDQSAKETAAFEARDHQQLTAASEQMGNEVDGCAAAKGRLQLRYEQRQTWITRASHAVREQLAADVNTRDEACRAQAQQGLTAAEQQRDAALAQAAANHNEAQAQHGEAAASFQQLEKNARRALGGYASLRRLLAAEPPAPAFPGDAQATLAEHQQTCTRLMADLDRFKKAPLPQVFRFLPIWLLGPGLLALALAVPALQHTGHTSLTSQHALLAGVALGVVLAAYWLGLRTARPAATSLAADFIRARQLLAASAEKLAAEYQSELARIEQEFQAAKNTVNQTWKLATKEIARQRTARPTEVEDRVLQLQKKNKRQLQSLQRRLLVEHEKIMAGMKLAADQQARLLNEAHQTRRAALELDFKTGWETLVTDWHREALPLAESLQSAAATAAQLFPGWQAPGWDQWTPPANFLNAAPFAQLEVELAKFTGGLPKDPRLALPCPPTLSLPLLLAQPGQGSLLIETGQHGGEEAIAAINNLILRLLATTPPGRIEFTIFDPVGLGQNFASLMHLADYEANTINSRIWTQAAQFEEKLAELNEHMEKIIQMYLRNEYATITEYNAAAGSIAEKYHYLVIASFPVNFSDTAARRLRNIAANGARCGVFTLIQWDQRNAVPADFVPDELRNHSVCLTRTNQGFEFNGWRQPGTRVILDPLPAAEFTTQLLHQIGDAGKNANRVEVPFAQIAPATDDVWTEETGTELRVPIGRSGATKLQYLAVGRDTRQHALIAGKTGSGKSTLFHIIITNLALRCSPEQVEFYLVDFKKGVEFKCYGNHHLPHAKVVAIESDRAFGLSVLQRVDEELRRRGDLFRQAGAQDVEGYKRAVAAAKTGAAPQPMPRTLLLIDEFQELFVEEDRISQNAAVLLDRIVRQGRAFGIHVILGSQTLGGAYTLARATIGQMVIRIALQCNEADAFLIMDQDNPAPRLLSRPGEGIYNDAAGAIEGNSPFQAVWLSDRVREEYLAQIRARADRSGQNYPGPIVFEGNAPADVRDNLRLRAALQTAPGEKPAVASTWLGAPNSIKGPTEAAFRRQSAANLLIVGQSEERGLTILSVALVALAAQHRPEDAQFFVLHNLPAGTPQLDFFQRIIQAVPQTVTTASNGTLAEVMDTLAAELKRRQETEVAAPEVFVLIHDLQNFKKLRQEDEYSFSASAGEATAAATLVALITDGPARGIHVLFTCDSYGNVNRFLGRKTLAEIEMRVAFQMSAADSANLIDAPDASTLGLHRAVLFNDRESSLETFRPYALPDNGWVAEIAKQLAGQRNVR